jgi:putative MATE family efflux protein
MPFLILLGAVGAMLGTGGSALIAKTLGEKKNEKANELFSMLIYTLIGAGVILAIIAIAITEDVARLLGAEGEMLRLATVYGRINFIALPAWMLQYAFQSLFVTAEKPQVGLAFTVAAGVTNMVLDAVLVGALGLGVVGAATATGLSQAVGGVAPIFYFSRKKCTALVRLGRCKIDLKALCKTCTNGSSEFLSNISMSVVGMLYNAQLLRYAGERGVSAYGVLMYVGMIFISIFIGYSVGSSPVVGYHYGAGNRDELKSLRKKSLILMVSSSAVMLAAALLLARPLSIFFVGYDKELCDMTVRGFYFFSFSFLFSGLPIFASSFFTALNDGLTSAIISFMRTIVFQTLAVIFLPMIWKLDGIWTSIVVADIAAAAVGVILLIAKRKKYGY